MLAVVCDDLVSDQERLLEYCARYAQEQQLSLNTASFSNAGELLQSEAARGADVLFLDIYMEGALGVDAARILRDKGFSGAVVFTTTSREHYAAGYEVDAAHYLLKPVSWEGFCEAMRRAQSRMAPAARKLQVTTGRMELEIDLSSIQYIEVYGHKTLLHTRKGDLTVSQSLASLEQALGGAPFLRCYRYFIVNMDFVQRVNEDSFLMKDGREIPLSRDRRAGLKSQYLSYVFKHMEG